MPKLFAKKYILLKNNGLIRPIHVYKERRGYIINFLISNLIINKKKQDTLSLCLGKTKTLFERSPSKKCRSV